MRCELLFRKHAHVYATIESVQVQSYIFDEAAWALSFWKLVNTIWYRVEVQGPNQVV